MKTVYVKTLKVLRGWASNVGLLRWLERSSSRRMLWVRSLFAIYDSKDLTHLDLPWWTFAAISETEAFLNSRGNTARVYEYGAGASTVWLAKRAASVRSVEHDRPFAEDMAPLFKLYENIEVRVIEATAVSSRTQSKSNRKGYAEKAFDDYVSSIDDVDEIFDLIVIDGRARIYCLDKAISKLKPDGIILFDNSDRKEYRKAIEMSGLNELKLRGSAPALPFPSQTSLLTLRT
ncbi:methyltransferase family protein [Ochrobactrum sp. J50]|uniref:class I SAM-dependent methyltransferase n=1 Tax=Ochrobactrum sp. J50 TaxID=936132 RepID=UPI0011ACA2AD|nr:class I SAM-dependent methyltransferase [Ochrobactrum sp. J50]TWH02335.1 methyltransferase family protein [Ochrobactrum sp. J50]